MIPVPLGELSLPANQDAGRHLTRAFYATPFVARLNVVNSKRPQKNGTGQRLRFADQAELAARDIA